MFKIVKMHWVIIAYREVNWMTAKSEWEGELENKIPCFMRSSVTLFEGGLWLVWNISQILGQLLQKIFLRSITAILRVEKNVIKYPIKTTEGRKS